MLPVLLVHTCSSNDRHHAESTRLGKTHILASPRHHAEGTRLGKREPGHQETWKQRDEQGACQQQETTARDAMQDRTASRHGAQRASPMPFSQDTHTPHPHTHPATPASASRHPHFFPFLRFGTTLNWPPEMLASSRCPAPPPPLPFLATSFQPSPDAVLPPPPVDAGCTMPFSASFLRRTNSSAKCRPSIVELLAYTASARIDVSSGKPIRLDAKASTG
ncbi:hypothetical protein VTK73DRAFT_3216 [Phialemonium thermophilum]|uniref:Uncharacterized protein n=1 Tax=Phialemonium thermophilum TaxID=223376 RepID=A0ABR3VKX7_9PEZI